MSTLCFNTTYQQIRMHYTSLKSNNKGNTNNNFHKIILLKIYHGSSSWWHVALLKEFPEATSATDRQTDKIDKNPNIMRKRQIAPF